MLIILLALQMSSTNCIPDYTGGMMCTTMTTPPLVLPQAPSIPRTTRGSGSPAGNLIGIIERFNDRSLRKKIGKLIAAGDCEGAAKLAYEKGWLEMGADIKRSCNVSEATKNTDWDWVKTEN